MHCRYCDLITTAEPLYTSREAEFDLGSHAPRCPWHWRLTCDDCGAPDHYMRRFHCPVSERILCGTAGAVARRNEPFWAWGHSFLLACPDCGAAHDSLDRAEYDGRHPWQLGEERRALSAESHIVRYPLQRFRRLALSEVDDAAVDATWSANADFWDANYDERGDLNRRYGSDPVLLEMIGEVAGRRVLDLGSGQGYLSRMLARSGAIVTGVENAQRFYEIALGYQERERLAIAYVKGSISSMPFLGEASFDIAVANYVLIDVVDHEAALQEVGRVLRPGGRLVAAFTHQSLDFAWYLAAPDSPRREDRLFWTDDDYFVRRAGYVAWGEVKPFISFHRPLRDYVAAARMAGLELRDLDEPELSEEGRQALAPDQVRDDQRMAVSYVLRFEKPVR